VTHSPHETLRPSGSYNAFHIHGYSHALLHLHPFVEDSFFSCAKWDPGILGWYYHTGVVGVELYTSAFDLHFLLSTTHIFQNKIRKSRGITSLEWKVAVAGNISPHQRVSTHLLECAILGVLLAQAARRWVARCLWRWRRSFTAHDDILNDFLRATKGEQHQRRQSPISTIAIFDVAQHTRPRNRNWVNCHQILKEIVCQSWWCLNRRLLAVSLASCKETFRQLFPLFWRLPKVQRGGQHEQQHYSYLTLSCLWCRISRCLHLLLLIPSFPVPVPVRIIRPISDKQGVSEHELLVSPCRSAPSPGCRSSVHRAAIQRISI